MVTESWNAPPVCLVCITTPLIKFIAPFLFVKTACKHSSSRCSTSEHLEIITPKIYPLLLCFGFASLVIGFVMEVNVLRAACLLNEGDCLLVLSNSILMFAGMWMTFQTYSKSNYWITEVNKWSFILDELAQEAIMFEILRKFSKEYFWKASLALSTILFQVILLVMIFVFTVQQNGTKVIVSELTLLVTTFIQISAFIAVSYLSSIIKAVFDKCGVLFSEQVMYGRHIIENVDRFKNYLMTASYTWRSLNKTVNTSPVIFMICYVAMIILNIYYFIVEFRTKSIEVLLISWYRWVFVTGILVYTVTALDQERMVSFFTDYF